MKRNGYLDRLQAEQDRQMKSMIHLTEDFIRQLMMDFFCIAMRENGIGEERVWKICDSAMEVNREFATMWQGEISTKQDTDKKGYTRLWLQRRLETLCGKKVIPWEARYAGMEQAWELCYTSKNVINRM